MEAIRVAIAGAGNVAAHLAAGIATADGYELVAVASRNPSNAENLGAATTAACRYDDLASFAPDILIVSVADKAIDDVTAAIGPMPPNTVVALTSGTLAKERLAPVSARNGIFYPFQTFTKGYATDLGCVPFFIEGATEQEAEILASLARKLSRSVHFADAAHRQQLHIAGVFTSNFTNTIIGVVQTILDNAGFSRDVAVPLLNQTLAKAAEIGAYAAQTGPAVRGDIAVMKKQLEELPEEFRPTYRALSQLIMSQHNIPYEQNQL